MYLKFAQSSSKPDELKYKDSGFEFSSYIFHSFLNSRSICDIDLHLIYLPVFALCKVDDECDNVNDGGEGAGLFFPLDHDPRRWLPGFEPEHPD